MIQVEGNLSIGTYNEKPTAIIAKEIVQNNTQLNIDTHIPEDNEETSYQEEQAIGKIRFNDATGNRINFYRVILSLFKCGFFMDPKGGKTTMKDVFESFGKMLGDDFKGFHKNLSEASKDNDDSKAPTAIFDELKSAYLQYEKDKLNKK